MILDSTLRKIYRYCITKIVSVSVIILFFTLGWKEAEAQSQGEIILNDRFHQQPLQDFIDSLERKYHLRVFYKEEWIRDFIFTRSFNHTPLIQALNNLFYERHLTYRFFQDDGVVIYPVVQEDYSRQERSSHAVTIGNPLNQGRYKEALLRGRILEGKTGEPLVGAIVYHPKRQLGASTDAQGVFELKLPVGDHELQFSSMGLQSAVWRIRIIEDGSADFELYEESHAIEEVTVFGKEADMSRSQMSVAQMSSLEIKQIPALMGEVDILKGMALLPGVQTVGELASGFNVRGGNTDQNLILINGSPIFNASHLFGFLSLINPDVVDHIRIFKGGLPVKFGERTASVVEIGLRDGNDQQVRFSGGIGLINSRLAVDGPLSKDKNLTFSAGGRSSYTNWLMSYIPDAALSQSVTRFYDLSGKMTYKFDYHNRISMTGYLSGDEFNTSTRTVIQYKNVLGSVETNNRISERLYGDLLVSYSRYNYRLTDFANNNPPDAYHLDNRISYASMAYHFRWHPVPLHKAMAGIKAIRYAVNPGEIAPVEIETGIDRKVMQKENAWEFALFIGDETEPFPGVSVSGGLRFSYFLNLNAMHNDLLNGLNSVQESSLSVSETEGAAMSTISFGGLEPRISFGYDVNRATIKLSYQRVRQYLFQLSNNAVVSPAEIWKLSDNDLNPLISDQVALGIESSSWLPKVHLSSELYYKDLTNLIEYKNGAQLIMNDHVGRDLINADGFSYGIELSAQKNSGRLTGSAGYVFSRTMQKTNALMAEDQIREGKFYPSIYDKPHDFSMMATYHASRRWRFTAGFVFVSGRPVTLPEMKYRYAGETVIYYSDRNKYRMPPYHRLDFSITFDENLRKKRMWKGSWTLSVYNLYGRENPYSVYYRKATPGVDNQFRKYALYQLSVIGIPVPSLTYNFKF